MKKTLKIILIVLAAVLVIGAVGITAYTGHLVVANSTQLSHAVDEVDVPYNVYKAYHLDYDAFRAKYRSETISLTSSMKDGHAIPADYIYAEGVGSRDHDTVIMVHGMGGNRMTVYPVAQVFLENGYNVLAYDQRSSGENRALHTTFGYLEKFDLMDCAKAVKEWAPDQKMGVWGTSFGGITSVLAVFDPAQGIAAGTDFLILDSPISNMEDELRVVMGSGDPDVPETDIPIDYLIFAGNLMNRIELGFSYRDADGRHLIETRKNQSTTGNRDVPLLIFICDQDELTPYPQGADLYEKYQGANKTLVTFEGSKHADGWRDHEAEYREAVVRLLDSLD